MTDPWAVFGAVAAAHALGVASPGPDFAMVVRQALVHGRRAGMITALGIGSGIAVHVSWGMFGLGWAVQQFPPLIEVMRHAGAAFLLWMGAKALRSRPAANLVAAGTGAEMASPWRAFGVGFLTNLFNAKAALFFVALCSSVISAGASTALKLGLGLWLMGATAGWFAFVAVTVSHASIRARLLRHAHRVDQLMGAILVLLACGIMADRWLTFS